MKMIITNLDAAIEHQRSIEHCGPYGKEDNPNSRWYVATEEQQLEWESEAQFLCELEERAEAVGYVIYIIDSGDCLEYQLVKDNICYYTAYNLNGTEKYIKRIEAGIR